MKFYLIFYNSFHRCKVAFINVTLSRLTLPLCTGKYIVDFLVPLPFSVPLRVHSLLHFICFSTVRTHLTKCCKTDSNLLVLEAPMPQWNRNFRRKGVGFAKIRQPLSAGSQFLAKAFFDSKFFKPAQNSFVFRFVQITLRGFF